MTTSAAADPTSAAPARAIVLPQHEVVELQMAELDRAVLDLISTSFVG